MGKNKTKRPDDVRCCPEKNLTFPESFTHKAKLVILQVTQTAMNQFSARRRCAACQVVLFTQENRQPSACCITGNSTTVYAATDNRQVIFRILHNVCLFSINRKVSESSLFYFECALANYKRKKQPIQVKQEERCTTQFCTCVAGK